MVLKWLKEYFTVAACVFTDSLHKRSLKKRKLPAGGRIKQPSLCDAQSRQLVTYNSEYVKKYSSISAEAQLRLDTLK